MLLHDLANALGGHDILIKLLAGIVCLIPAGYKLWQLKRNSCFAQDIIESVCIDCGSHDVVAKADPTGFWEDLTCSDCGRLVRVHRHVDDHP